MVDYREILRLQSLGHNITQIAGALHSSHNTVREVERLADEKGIRWPLEEEVTNPQLYVLLYPERQEKQTFIWNQTVHGSTVNWQKRSKPDIAFGKNIRSIALPSHETVSNFYHP